MGERADVVTIGRAAMLWQQSPSVPSQSLLAPYFRGSQDLSVQLIWSMTVGWPSSGMKSYKEHTSYKMQTAF